MKALSLMEPAVAKNVGKEIRSAGSLIAAVAKANAPQQPTMSGWRETDATRGRTRGGAGWPAWETPGVSVRRKGGAVVVSSTGAVAAIYESAGKNGLGGLSRNGGQFIRNNSRYGRLQTHGKRTGRLMIPAVAATYPAVIAQITKACERAVEEVNRRMP